MVSSLGARGELLTQVVHSKFFSEKERCVDWSEAQPDSGWSSSRTCLLSPVLT